MAKNAEYGNESISSLKGAERVRLRPGVIFGSDGIEGCEHSFFEILSNSIDEAREGYGNLIEVKRYKDGTLEVRDYGRGIPLDYNSKEGKYNWELVYCELYAGGKYNNNSGENYEFSLGLNGLGACATQYASEFFEVEVVRDGFRYSLCFKKGEVAGELSKESVKSRKTGTIQKWKPDREVFTDIAISSEYFNRILMQQAIVNAGIRFKFIDETDATDKEFYYPDGVLGYVKELDAQKGFTQPVLLEGAGKGRDRADKPEYKFKLSLAFCFNNEVNVLDYFHNSSFLEHGGSPDKAVKQAFTSEIDKLIRLRGKYKADESKVSFTDIQDSLILVSSSFSTQTSYENQTKKAISNKFIQDFMTEFLRQKLEVYFIENKLDADKLVEQILANKRSRESAEKQRINLKKKLMGNMDLIGKVKKFVDCRSRIVAEREIYIVEGDSALGSCKQGRDAAFQAIMPVRGKILNCLKADYESIFKSEIITDLVKVLGCGVEIQTKHNKDLSAFDLAGLRWDKIIICTDADVDGFHIRTMILTMLYRLVPTIIEEGKVYIAESPLFEITVTKKAHKKSENTEETYFAYNEKERAEIIQSNRDCKIAIQRSKGLGENEPEMMWRTTMNPESRRLIQVVPEEAAKTAKIFDMLLGDDLASRKQFIEDFGYLYIEDLDLD
ncbi:MAG: DNA gyrase/topoisomerase IV subunit B [Saccharofermentanales bacterium]